MQEFVRLFKAEKSRSQFRSQTILSYLRHMKKSQIRKHEFIVR